MVLPQGGRGPAEAGRTPRPNRRPVRPRVPGGAGRHPLSHTKELQS